MRTFISKEETVEALRYIPPRLRIAMLEKLKHIDPEVYEYVMEALKEKSMEGK